jgi:AcrR family transcriptional regulator
MTDLNMTIRNMKKNQTRQRLFEAACRLFSCNKFEEVKIEDITREAGYGKGTFFNYFDSKEDVVSEMQFTTMYDALMPLLEMEGPYVPRLKEALIKVLVDQGESKTLTRSIFMTKFKDECHSAKHAEQFKDFYAGMQELVDRSKAYGEIRSDIPSEEVVRMVGQLHMGVLVKWSIDLDESRLDTHIGSAFDILFDGLRPKKESENPTQN